MGTRQWAGSQSRDGTTVSCLRLSSETGIRNKGDMTKGNKEAILPSQLTFYGREEREAEETESGALGSSLFTLGLGIPQGGSYPIIWWEHWGPRDPCPDPCSELQKVISWKGTLGINMGQAELHGWAEKRGLGGAPQILSCCVWHTEAVARSVHLAQRCKGRWPLGRPRRSFWWGMRWPHSADCLVDRLARLSGRCMEARLSKARSEAPGTLRGWPYYGHAWLQMAAECSLMTGDNCMRVSGWEPPTPTSSAAKSRRPASC